MAWAKGKDDFTCGCGAVVRHDRETRWCSDVERHFAWEKARLQSSPPVVEAPDARARQDETDLEDMMNDALGG